MQAPMPRAGPIMVVEANRDQGKEAQLSNLQAGKTIADFVRTTLGPKACLKMLLDPMGGIVLTNDGNAILREIDVTHPAAKSVIELSRALDEETGDGTTSVVILAGEMLAASEQFLTKRIIHPTVMVKGYMLALDFCLSKLESIALHLDLNDRTRLVEVVNSCLNTKFCARWGSKVAELALEAAETVQEMDGSIRNIDIKRNARVIKIPGGEWEESRVLKGIMINKDVVHAKMRRSVRNPRICLLDCTLEYKKGESMTNIEISNDDDFAAILDQEEKEIKKMCESIINSGATVCFTEKGVSDLAQHFLLKAGISVVRRIKKTDNNRLARVCGATIVNRLEELKPADVGSRAGLFEIRKIGDEYYAFVEDCADPKACTIILRGASKDSLNEIERNLNDAMFAARNILLEGKLLPGGGATEMELACRVNDHAAKVEGLAQWPFKAVATALEAIPRTLAQNCGAEVVRKMTSLRAKHADAGQGCNIGFDGQTGDIVDVVENGIWDTYTVKVQVLKTAIEAACMIVRIDDVLSGVKPPSNKTDEPQVTNYEAPQQFGDSRDG
ncbi:MAG: hypothetical protein KVP17_001775 [Porospora cf. gigantea B]|uniref:uncharacterized protein n=2 Tax=Porospora cf. gigantea B TaxID=2853592 RepID=UPI003571BB08|nr:MAG: hypothetical protein KVP17_001775 [Porospora cf. gigantea B]